MVKDKKVPLMKKVDGFLKRKGRAYKEWSAKAPERRKDRHENTMEKLERQIAESKLRKELMNEQSEMGKMKAEMAEKRKEAMGNMPSMFGNSGSKDNNKEVPSMFGNNGAQDNTHKELPSASQIFGFDTKHKKGDKPPVPRM